MVKSAPYLIIGAGIHGLSTALHLAKKLKATGKGSGADILVIDKTGIAAGASGIACGVVRNNYFQPAMRELMAHSVQHWEAHAEAFQYNPVGYMQISAESMREDVAQIHQEQAAIGYESVFIDGAKDSDTYMKGIFDDWTAQGITSVLHEKRGGFAHNAPAMYALATMAEAEGVRIQTGITVTGMKFANGANSAVTGVETDKGDIECDYLVVATGPWVRDFWHMADLPSKISIKGSDGTMHDNQSMWTFWQLEEGVLRVDPESFKTNEGKLPPVIHVDTDAPLISDVDGSTITEEMWGIYYKPDTNFGGIQGGAMPYPVNTPVDEVAIDPYGPSSPEFVSSPEFAHMWVSALAHCNARFKGTMPKYHKEASGGIGCFTADSFPVFDAMRENLYIIADSNHGYKMIGVGELVADEIIGRNSTLLEPFRFSRFAEGKLHPVSNSPYPWS
ncbi:N-methyltryptophan oxidase [Pelagimonas phthalicica]|uniref:N-methyltryptophan oxidase n=1 Tax=Pelagimonas phthalicica TaxID=1037362 RepID=A0A238JIJ4_9RHOB|nr:FAD-binding oxidoreductase [Pelagimonas phthalicica]TDS88412.1 glycine/D-amino acid oxidase-like deaminating enzyme [Pelagimonas phthalicica]SMX30498.1 N-methyltryptophan oxidase [Pelagimonas phthalicica]